MSLFKRDHRVRLTGVDVVTHGLPRPFGANAYHFFLTLTWPQYILATAIPFLVLNVAFALLYLLDSQDIANQNPPGFWGAFFFSVETLATVGYGDMHPATLYGHLLATTEIFIGMTGIALQTGLVFARFSRPRALIEFARNPVILHYDGRLTLMVRTANARQNVIIDAAARLHLLQWETSAEGLALRRIHDLVLVRERQPMFVLGWNLMHVIDEESPLWDLDAQSMIAQSSVLILTMQGNDETTSQNMQARKSYNAEDIRWQHRYRDMLRSGPDGITHMNYDYFHDVIPVETPLAPDAAA